MFPQFNASGVLPPFSGANPTERGGSPYVTDFLTVAQRLGGTPQRREILCGLIGYRAALRAVGITSGFQLLDGSFVEDCERTRAQPPADIDIVTFAHIPVLPHEVAAFAEAHQELFDKQIVKDRYKCDAYFVDLTKDVRLVVEDTMYWYGLFSHQRNTALWKGMLRLPLLHDDRVAQEYLNQQNVEVQNA